MEDVGFIGLGAMGSRMARHLISQGRDQGFKVHVHDLNQAAVAEAVAAGALACASPAAVADSAELVLVCLPTPDAVRAVALGPGGIVEGGKVRIYVDHSTTGPSVAREVAAGLAARQVVALDGPLSGGIVGAEAGTLSVMVSGEEWAFQKIKPILQSFGGNVGLVGGEPGHGQILKIANNMIAAATLVAATEAVLFGVRAGLPATTMIDMINTSSGRSFATEQILGKYIKDQDFNFGFRAELMRKDVRLCVSEADAAGVPMFVNNLVRQFFDMTVNHGNRTDDILQIVRELERLSGVSLHDD
jgi:3-hydroxyisobutyrate dehydrogenase-like beta-hydroxyacid dehydrogenase